MNISLALFQPDIPQNTGAIIRLTACLETKLHIIHPTGFPFSHSKLKRAGLDYVEHATIIEHDSFDDFENWRATTKNRLVLLSTKAERSAYETEFTRSDILLMGRESAGVPDYVKERADIEMRIPMGKNMRSLNVALAAAMVLGEAIRQTEGFSSLS